MSARAFSGPTWRDVTVRLESLRAHFGGAFAVGMTVDQSRWGNAYQYWMVRWAPSPHMVDFAWRRAAGGHWHDPAYQSVPELLISLCQRLWDAMEMENQERTRKGLPPLGRTEPLTLDDLLQNVT